jgi:hypothetical protein
LSEEHDTIEAMRDPRSIPDMAFETIRVIGPATFDPLHSSIREVCAKTLAIEDLASALIDDSRFQSQRIAGQWVWSLVAPPRGQFQIELI